MIGTPRHDQGGMEKTRKNNKTQNMARELLSVLVALYANSPGSKEITSCRFEASLLPRYGAKRQEAFWLEIWISSEPTPWNLRKETNTYKLCFTSPGLGSPDLRG